MNLVLCCPLPPCIDSRTTNILYHFILFYSCLFSVNIHILSITKARRKKNDYPMEKKRILLTNRKAKETACNTHTVFNKKFFSSFYVFVRLCQCVCVCVLVCSVVGIMGMAGDYGLEKSPFLPFRFLKIFIQLNVSHSTAKTVKNRFIRCETLL